MLRTLTNKELKLMDNQVILHKNAEPIKVKLVRSVTGKIGWEITVEGQEQGAILLKIGEIDDALRVQYAEKIGE